MHIKSKKLEVVGRSIPLTWLACSVPCAHSRALMRPSDISNRNPVKFSKEWLPWTSGSAVTGADLALLMLLEKKMNKINANKKLEQTTYRITVHHLLRRTLCSNPSTAKCLFYLRGNTDKYFPFNKKKNRFPSIPCSPFSSLGHPIILRHWSTNNEFIPSISLLLTLRSWLWPADL